jgi:hypothetical protein
VLGADGSLSIEPIEQVGKVVGVIEFKVNLRYVVHQRWPERDRIDNCPHVATRYFFHHVSHLRIKPWKSSNGKRPFSPLNSGGLNRSTQHFILKERWSVP